MTFEEVQAFYSGKLDLIGNLGASLKFDLGNQFLLLDGRTKPATVSSSQENADCTIITSLDSLSKMLKGEISGLDAFSTGKLRLEGEAKVALKFFRLRGGSLPSAATNPRLVTGHLLLTRP